MRKAWNKGLKLSEEGRRKLSEAHKGYKHTLEQKNKIAKALLGIKRSPESIERMRIAQSSRSLETRKRISEAKKGEKNGMYGLRGEDTPNWKGGITPINLAFRNSRPFQNYPELRLEISNGLTLCLSCHTKTDNFAGKVLYELQH